MLGQYGLLYALKNSDAIDKLVILNTPLDIKATLRPELAAYKNPISFLRPKTGAPFDAMTYAANGLAYSMQFKDAQVSRIACSIICLLTYTHPMDRGGALSFRWSKVAITSFVACLRPRNR